MHAAAGGRRMLAAVGSAALGAGLALTLTPPTATAAPAAFPGERPASATPPAGPQEQIRSDRFPARLGDLTYRSVYGSSKVTSSTGKKLMLALSGSKAEGEKPSFYLSLSRGDAEQHAWMFEAPNSAFDISAKGAGKMALSSEQTGGMGKIALDVEPDGDMKSHKCGGKVYAKSRNVVVAGTVFFDTGSSKWGKAGSKRKKFTFQTEHRAYFSYDQECPPVEYPNPCYNDLSWSASHSTEKSYTSVYGTKKGSGSAVSGYRSVKLDKPKGAWRYDAAWGTGKAPDLTVAPDESATMEIHGVKGSGTIADPNPSSPFDYPCDTGTQYNQSWWQGTVTNGDKAVKIPAQAFGAFKVPDGSDASMSHSWSE